METQIQEHATQLPGIMISVFLLLSLLLVISSLGSGGPYADTIHNVLDAPEEDDRTHVSHSDFRRTEARRKAKRFQLSAEHRKAVRRIRKQ